MGKCNISGQLLQNLHPLNVYIFLFNLAVCADLKMPIITRKIFILIQSLPLYINAIKLNL